MILDASAISAIFAGESGIAEILAGVSRHHLPTVVIGEYRYGLLRSRERRPLSALLDALIGGSIVLPIDVATATHYATLRDELRQRGTPIPENDVWIAALARQHGLAIASRDAHFDHVEGIDRRSW